MTRLQASALPGFRLPRDGEHAFLCGMTGTGKTRAGVWQLGMRSFDRMPWTILDFKGDDLLKRIEYVRELRLSDRPAKHPGLYIVRPRPDEHDEVVAWMWQLWERGKHGLFIDEGYMAGGQGRANKAYDALLTQGRSKLLPVITLTQRPAWLNRFVISEASFFQVFHLNGKADKERVREFVPAIVEKELPRFHSHWYCVPDRFYTHMLPVPDDAAILQTFHDRLKPRRKLV